MIKEKNIKYIEMCKFYFNWFLKGPFAYEKVLEKAEENNVYPKLTKKIKSIVTSLHNLETKVKEWIRSKINKFKERKNNKAE